MVSREPPASADVTPGVSPPIFWQTFNERPRLWSAAFQRRFSVPQSILKSECFSNRCLKPGPDSAATRFPFVKHYDSTATLGPKSGVEPPHCCSENLRG